MRRNATVFLHMNISFSHVCVIICSYNNHFRLVTLLSCELILIIETHERRGRQLCGGRLETLPHNKYNSLQVEFSLVDGSREHLSQK